MASAAPRTTPLTLISGAVAGDDLEHVVNAAADALGCPVAVAIPAVGEPVVQPPGSITAAAVREIIEHAEAVISGYDPDAPATIDESVHVRIGEEVVGIVVAVTDPVNPRGEAVRPDQRAWLEAAAAAAAVSAMLREAHEGGLDGARRALLQALVAGPPADAATLITQARRLGLDLASGALAICARATDQLGARQPLPADNGTLLADLGDGKVFGLLPLALANPPGGAAETLAAELAGRGLTVALSVPRRDPAALHEALREAELLFELGDAVQAPPSEQEATYRLLIGVLLRDPAELEQLRERTISPLAAYDAQHETDLLATLRSFLAHHGSTTETAVAMQLHRHTVGYRLSRVHEVSGLSPYESDGRERLSLGLKAHEILEADRRCLGRE